MMKKLLLVLGLIIISASSVMARSFPRWSVSLLNVHIHSVEKESVQYQTVQKAFKSWQTAGGSILKFLFKPSAAFERTAQINVYFVDNLSQEAYYVIEPITNQTYFNSPYLPGYFIHVNIKIRNTEPDGSKLSQKKLYAIALQAVGRAVGISCLDDAGNAMSCKTDFTAKALTQKDINALNKVYRYQHISVKKK